jgi:hypothetical protein
MRPVYFALQADRHARTRQLSRQTRTPSQSSQGIYSFPPAAFDATQISVPVWISGKDNVTVRVEVADSAPDQFRTRR